MIDGATKKSIWLYDQRRTYKNCCKPLKQQRCIRLILMTSDVIEETMITSQLTDVKLLISRLQTLHGGIVIEACALGTKRMIIPKQKTLNILQCNKLQSTLVNSDSVYSKFLLIQTPAHGPSSAHECAPVF